MLTDEQAVTAQAGLGCKLPHLQSNRIMADEVTELTYEMRAIKRSIGLIYNSLTEMINNERISHHVLSALHSQAGILLKSLKKVKKDV